MAGADQRGQPVAQPARQIEPARRIPAADQALAPFGGHHFGGARGGGTGAGAERVAIEIDHAGRQRKLLAQAAQRVVTVERDAIFTGQIHGLEIRRF
ncbi:hypothetical protein D3C86_1471810 [compost metagenome]